MHVKDHAALQQVLSTTPVIALTALIPEKESKTALTLVRVPNTLSTRRPDEGAYLRLALKACQSEQRFPPTSVCYEVEDRSLPSVSSF
jgi:hypothetical protein